MEEKTTAETISATTEPLRSDYILEKIIDELGITDVKTSAYKEYSLSNGDVLRVRLSNHGVILSNWHNNYSGSSVSLENSDNIAITIMPNRTECAEKGMPFPPPIINKTQVRVSKDSKEEIDYSFYVMHYLYHSWEITEEQITLIVSALKEFIQGNGYIDPLRDTSSKAYVFKDASNKPYEKIKESKINKKMKNTQRLNEQNEPQNCVVWEVIVTNKGGYTDVFDFDELEDGTIAAGKIGMWNAKSIKDIINHLWRYGEVTIYKKTYHYENSMMCPEYDPFSRKIIGYSSGRKRVLDSRIKYYSSKINESKNMKKNVKRINENQLRAIVAESVKKILREGYNEGGAYTVSELIADLQKRNSEARVEFYCKADNSCYPISAINNENYGGWQTDGQRVVFYADSRDVPDESDLGFSNQSEGGEGLEYSGFER